MTRKHEASGDLTDLIDRRRGDLPPDELAAAFKAWREPMLLPHVASELGLSKRTLENIEQGRGFRHQRLLLLAMRDLKPHGRWR